MTPEERSARREAVLAARAQRRPIGRSAVLAGSLIVVVARVLREPVAPPE